MPGVAGTSPAVGLGTFLGQLFLRKPLIEANTREFHITGPWADPKVERVERKSGSRLPSATAGDVPATPGTVSYTHLTLPTIYSV